MSRTSKRWGALLIGCCGLMILAGLWGGRAGTRYDRSRVDPRLLALRPPYALVACSYYYHGGSVGIRIVDAGGIEALFAIPAHLEDPDRYHRVFIGALHDRKPGAEEIPNPGETRRMLISILVDYPRRTPWDDLCLMNLRGTLNDYIRCLMHRALGDYPQ